MAVESPPPEVGWGTNPAPWWWFINRVNALLMAYPSTVTSWWRSAATNARVGGHPRSWHLYGLAVDLVPGPGVRSSDLSRVASGYGLQVVDEGDHLHLEVPF